MKKILLFTLILAGAGAYAQSFQILNESGSDVTGGTVTFAGPNSPSDPWFKYEIDLDVVNLSGSTLTTKVKRIETGVLANSGHYHCWNVCYGEMAAGADYIFPEPGDAEFLDSETMPGGDTATINTYLRPKTGVGQAVFRFVVFDDANPNDSAYVDVQWDIHAFTGVEELKKNMEVSMYPNPANVAATISFAGNENESGNMTVEVTDMLGKKHSTQQIAASTRRVNLNTEELRAGIYFVTVRKDNQVIKTSKLIVRH